MGAEIAIIIKTKRMLKVFKDRGATSPKKAINPSDLIDFKRFTFNRLVKKGILKEAYPGLYYIDEGRENEVQKMEMTVLAVILVLLVTGLIIIVAIPK